VPDQGWTSSAAVAWYRWGRRSYDPHLRRFLQSDPSKQGSLPDYTYANDDSLDVSDVQGTAGTPAQCGTQAADDDPTQHAACNVRAITARQDQATQSALLQYGLAIIPFVGEVDLGAEGVLGTTEAIGASSEAALGVDAVRGLNAVRSVAAADRSTSFLSEADLLLPKLGPAPLSHPEEYDAIMQELDAAGVDVQFRPGQLAYSAAEGGPGRLILDPDASIGALRHAFQHFLDIRDEGYLGFSFYRRNPQELYRIEFRGYMQEIRLARQLGDFDTGRAILGQLRSRRADIFGE